MANYSITSAKPATGYQDVGAAFIAGAGGISIGDLVYESNETTHTVLPAINNDLETTGVKKSSVKGMAMNTAAEGARVIVGRGNITVNSVGEPIAPIVILAATAGKACPSADLGPGERVVPVGYWKSATEIVIDPRSLGIETPASTLAAAGSAQGDAASIVAPTTYVSGADGTKGVVLPAASAGTIRIVHNLHATNGLKIYPASGDDINDGSADAAITIEGDTHATFLALDSSTWSAVYTANS
jgi:hypothetical protein